MFHTAHTGNVRNRTQFRIGTVKSCFEYNIGYLEATTNYYIMIF